MGDRRERRAASRGIDRRVRERRAGDRIAAEASVRFLSSAGGGAIEGRLLDASACGLRVELDEPLAAGDRLLVEASAAGEHLFNATAEVVWTRPAGAGKQEAGCEFRVDLGRRQAALLRRLATAPARVGTRGGP